MDALKALFPAGDFTLLLVIIGLPLLGAIVNGLFGKRLGKEAVTLMALSAVGGSFLASVATFFLLADAQKGENAARFVWQGWKWVDLSLRSTMPGVEPQIPIHVTFSVDALSGTMALVVTGVGWLIHLYSTKYMAKDESYHRFFAYLNLFIFSMLVLILGDSLPILFVGWEGVGLCSYLLIGFWFGVEANAAAGKKAFIANRVGDFGLLVAMALLLYYVGALDWAGIESAKARLLQPVEWWPIGNNVPLASYMPHALSEWLLQPRYATAATLVGLALFLGCAGKSAQIPLYVWLPDAMAGPTPVSALIHAATMVTAGVYLVCRMAGVFVLSPAAMFTVAFIGACTALLAATIALAQNDIKKVLAYSTVSQLGYMFLGVGVGAFSAGFFHVITHAFFKACLFLGAGSVIYAMHKRIHDSDASQDMRNMGGLREYMPHTHWTFAASCLAIAGLPLTSGFFSKDAILLAAWTSAPKQPVADGALSQAFGNTQVSIPLFQWPSWGPGFLYGLGFVTAILTAFYMFRLYFGIFWGEFKGWSIVKKWVEPAHEHGHDDHGHDAHHAGAPLEGPKPGESPLEMTVPLMILGGLALVAGLLNAHLLKIHVFDHWLEPVFARAAEAVASEAETKEMLVVSLAVAAFAVGVGGAYWVYIMQKGQPAKDLVDRMPGLHALVLDKWRVDELYEETFIGAVDSLAEMAAWFDRWIVDGIVAGVTSFVVKATGAGLRLLQTGRVHAYAAVMVVGIGGLGWFLTLPHAYAKPTADDRSGSYSFTAAPGLGYQYRWDVDGDGKPDDDAFGPKQKVDLQLDVGQKRTVRLEVKNAFGRVASHDFAIERPKPDKSGAAGDTSVIDVQREKNGKLQGIPMPSALQGLQRLPALQNLGKGIPARQQGPGAAPAAPGGVR